MLGQNPYILCDAQCGYWQKTGQSFFERVLALPFVNVLSCGTNFWVRVTKPSHLSEYKKASQAMCPGFDEKFLRPQSSLIEDISGVLVTE
jgi:hypothetical protein